jgi:hypothetical protein
MTNSDVILTEQSGVTLMVYIVFQMYPVQFLAGTRTVLTEVFCRLPQSVQVNMWTVPKLGHYQ